MVETVTTPEIIQEHADITMEVSSEASAPVLDESTDTVVTSTEEETSPRVPLLGRLWRGIRTIKKPSTEIDELEVVSDEAEEEVETLESVKVPIWKRPAVVITGFALVGIMSLGGWILSAGYGIQDITTSIR